MRRRKNWSRNWKSKSLCHRNIEKSQSEFKTSRRDLRRTLSRRGDRHISWDDILDRASLQGRWLSTNKEVSWRRRRRAADRMSPSRRSHFRDVFTSCCTLAICC